jgi:hypothetical protein
MIILRYKSPGWNKYKKPKFSKKYCHPFKFTVDYLYDEEHHWEIFQQSKAAYLDLIKSGARVPDVFLYEEERSEPTIDVETPATGNMGEEAVPVDGNAGMECSEDIDDDQQQPAVPADTNDGMDHSDSSGDEQQQAVVVTPLTRQRKETICYLESDESGDKSDDDVSWSVNVARNVTPLNEGRGRKRKIMESNKDDEDNCREDAVNTPLKEVVSDTCPKRTRTKKVYPPRSVVTRSQRPVEEGKSPK